MEINCVDLSYPLVFSIFPIVPAVGIGATSGTHAGYGIGLPRLQ